MGAGGADSYKEEKLPDGPIKLKIGDIEILPFPQLYCPLRIEQLYTMTSHIGQMT